MTETRLERLLSQLYSHHSPEEWSKYEESINNYEDEDEHECAPPVIILFFCMEDVPFANELYQRILRKEDSLSWSSKSELKEEDWQRMTEKYASHSSLLDKFNAVVEQMNDIRYSETMTCVLSGFQDGTLSVGKDHALDIAEALISCRAMLHDEAVTLKSILICGGGNVPTLCQLPRDPSLTDIRNVLITSILEVFPFSLLNNNIIHQPITDTQFAQLSQNEILITSIYRSQKCMLDAYMNARPLEGQDRRRIVEQMMYTQLMTFTGWSMQQIQNVDKKYGDTELEKLNRRARQLVEGSSVALYIFKKLKENNCSKDLIHKLDFLWRSRIILCNW